jgi:hypothetical protein
MRGSDALRCQPRHFHPPFFRNAAPAIPAGFLSERFYHNGRISPGGAADLPPGRYRAFLEYLRPRKFVPLLARFPTCYRPVIDDLSPCYPPVPIHADFLPQVIVKTRISVIRHAEKWAILPVISLLTGNRRSPLTSRRDAPRPQKCPCRRGRRDSSPSDGPLAASARARSLWPARGPVQAPG